MITYKTKDKHPGALPFATIYMGGLLCLSFDSAKKCTVGVNSVGNGHKWKFSIVDQDRKTRKPILVRNEENARDLREIHIDVKGGATGGAYVFNGIDEVSIPGSNESRFNLESSWVDLEGPRGHNARVENDVRTLWPRFYINDGLFCALRLSTGLFALKDSNPAPVIKPLGKIALGVVADIFLDTKDPNSKIEVTLPGTTVSLDNTRRYQIHITNDCASAGPVQSDFPLHYKAFSGAFNGTRGKMKADDRFQLVSNNASAANKTASMVAQPNDLSDRAPCTIIALGQTSDFNA